MKRYSIFAASSATSAAILLASSVGVVVSQDSTTSHSTHDHDHEHGHEGEHFEAAAVYDVESGNNSLIAYPAEGSFEEVTFAFMIVPAASADDDGLEGAEEDAEDAWDAFLDGAEATALSSGEAASPSADVVYQIDLEDPLVVVPVDVVDAGAYAFFYEHSADEVVTALVSPSGTVLVAAAEEGADEEEEEEEEEEDETGSASASQWVSAVVASLIVSACSLAGLLVLANKSVANIIGLSHAFIFASGALLTASLLHIIPEAMEGLEEEYDSLHDLGLYAGLTVLGGISLGIVIHALLDTGDHSHGRGDNREAGARGSASAFDESKVPEQAYTGAQEKDVMKDSAQATQPPSPVQTNYDNLQELIAARKDRSLLNLQGIHPVCWNIIAGDLVHNFADGVTIGAAFLGCSSTMGWTVTASAVLHEFPHEIADFMALLNGGMSVKQAFAYNFLSALTAVLGTVIVLGLGETLSESHISFILLVGAGSFIFIGLSELLPDALVVPQAIISKGSRAVLFSQLRKLVSFLVGAIVIGIPLIFDEHCSANGHDHDH